MPKDAKKKKGRNTINKMTNNYDIQGDSPQMEFIYKKLCIYSSTFKRQSPPECSPSDAVPLVRRASHRSHQSLNSSILMPGSASAIFCFTSSTSAKRFPLRTFSSRETKKKITLGEIR